MSVQYDRTTPALDNTAVDNISQAEGQIDQFASLSFDMPDQDVVRNLDMRINDSMSYWNDVGGFDLQNSRNENVRYHLNKIDEKGLYKYQKSYKENQVFVAEESIVSYVTSQIAGPLVIPAGREEMHKLFASDLEKAIVSYCENVVSLEALVETWVRDLLNKRVAIAHFTFDTSLNDVSLDHVDPEHVILDKNCARGKNPAFLCHVLKRTPDELIDEFPDKKQAIMDHFGIKRKTVKQMTTEHAVRKVWITHYDKQNKPQEGVVWYTGDLVLAKMRNPHYLYAREDLNLLKYPKKPYIFGNLVNYGTHLIDSTTPLEQAIPVQQYLNRRGRQIGENADKANGVLVLSTSSGLTKDDIQNHTGDPNQKLLVQNENNASLDSVVKQLQAQMLPEFVIQDKLDARMQVGNIMGAPTDFTGADADEADPKVGIAIIKKNQANGRQDMMVRAITRMLSQVYEYLTQMFLVWYTEERQFVHDGGDGEFDFITIKRDLIQKGIRVKASKPANPDRSRIEAIILKLLDQKAISLLDAYKILQLDNAQQLYDNWAKQNADPMSLAREALDVVDESEAYVAYQNIMKGRKVEDKQNPTKEYILSLRKLMINDDFLQAKAKQQTAFIKYVNKCIDSFEQRLALEEASDVSGDSALGLRPGAPLPNPAMMPQQNMPMQQQPQPGQMPGQMQSGMAPGQPMPMQPSPPMNAMVPNNMPPPSMPMPQLTANSVFGAAPSQPPLPNQPSANLPVVQ